MAVKTREEIMQSLKEILGDNTSDEAIALIEDVHDTIGDGNLAARIFQLEIEKAELDSSWRKKYRDAFLSRPDDISIPEEPESNPVPKTFEDLFK